MTAAGPLAERLSSIFHPSDFSPSSEVAFAHALKIALLVRADLNILHILAVAGECAADLVVMATRGHDGFLDALRGSTTERVVRHARCPVLGLPVGARDSGRG